MPGQEGEKLATGAEAPQRIVAVRSSAMLSFDKAETIAARRLRELAIRLGDADTQGGIDRVPFDADRHFRERLAERMAALGAEATTVEPSKPAPYVVSDALSLDALGLSKSLLGGPGARPMCSDGAPLNEASAEADLDATRNDLSSSLPAGKADGDEDYPVFEPAVRLVDLINQQRTLVTRLANMSLAEDLEADTDLDVARLGVGKSGGAPQAIDAVAMSVAVDAVDARSDAEELFEAATHTAQPIADEGADDDALAPLAISAEQLIAALESGPLAVQSNKLEEKPLAELVLNGERPVTAHRESAVVDEESVERAPMIIERARAERAAIAASEAARGPKRHSGAVGFFAGLSLSIAVGIVLYYAL